DAHGSLLGGPKQLAEPVLGLFGGDFSHVGTIAIMALMVKPGLRAGLLLLPPSSAARGDLVPYLGKRWRKDMTRIGGRVVAC
ncbi:MAG: hypothetical protein OYK82_11555, partial [Gammaproteobacteria bacterium]|nr:hypothetical protein [Gammaproteobacteria bacterium]